MSYRLLDAFSGLFQGKAYRHRSSRLGDWVAMHLYEDLFELGRSEKLHTRIEQKQRVLAGNNRRRGVEARRGDGTFGDLVPGTPCIEDPGFHVARGETATVEIGVEVKILAKAMIKQIDRVINDLRNQVEQLKRGGDPICVGIVGINAAGIYTSYEKDRKYTTDGHANRHPVQEAAEAETRIRQQAAPKFDEFVILRFRAMNVAPFAFEWSDYGNTEKDYGAVLVRLSRMYDSRF